jgi:hypothetical protein
MKITINKTKVVKFLALLFVSVIIWRWSFVEVNALYPDWDDQTGNMLGFYIRRILIVSWSLWFVSVLSKKTERLKFWFQIGVFLAFLLSIVRLIFYKEMNELLDFLLRTGWH